MARTQAYDNIYSVTKKSEKTTNAGTGNFSTDEKYISGSIDVFIDGTIVYPTRITETGPKSYSVSSPPGPTSRVITKYNPLS